MFGLYQPLPHSADHFRMPRGIRSVDDEPRILPGQPMLVSDAMGVYTVRPTQRPDPRTGLVRCEVVHVLDPPELPGRSSPDVGDVLLIPAAELFKPCRRGRLAG